MSFRIQNLIPRSHSDLVPCFRIIISLPLTHSHTHTHTHTHTLSLSLSRIFHGCCDFFLSFSSLLISPHIASSFSPAPGAISEANRKAFLSPPPQFHGSLLLQSPPFLQGTLSLIILIASSSSFPFYFDRPFSFSSPLALHIHTCMCAPVHFEEMIEVYTG